MQATEHPTFIRARQRAAELGSSAKTLKGVTHFLKENPAPWRSFRPFRNPRPIQWRSKRGSAWEASVAERKSDPEFKRALRDQKFGLGFARQLRRSLEKDHSRILAGDPTSADKFLASLEKRLERINQIRAAHGLKSVRFTHQLHLISVTSEVAERVGVKLVKRGKDWSVEASYGANCFHHEDGETEWKNGVPKAYTRAVNENRVRSFAAIRSTQEIVYFLSDKVYQVALPPGYFWAIDQNGLRAVKTDSIHDDFHPEASDLICDGHRVVQQLEANRQQRLEAKAREAAALAEMEGVFVCLADSRRAGNCDAGSISFARRHGLDAARHYAAQELVNIANGDSGRVRLAITSAVYRHRKELAQGFSILTEHK
jgi:hypothetical protein